MNVELTLKEKDGKYCWMNVSGEEEYSPHFSTKACAVLYAERMPLIRHEEWVLGGGEEDKE